MTAALIVGRKTGLLGWFLIAWWGLLLFCSPSAFGAPFRVAVLMLGDFRSEPVSGLRDGLKALGYKEGVEVVYEIKNAGGHRDRLADLAQEIAGSRPDVATAAGGVEADALKAATAGSDLPVIFLAVASSVDRGLVASMKRSGNNLTGVDTNDTDLTAKRLWFVRKMLPQAKRVLIPLIPDIIAAVRTVEVAKVEAPKLGFAVRVLQGGNIEEITRGAQTLAPADADVIYIGMAAPVWQIEKTVFFPISAANGIPIMGVNREDLKRGAMAAYACSRYDTGKQAARLVRKIFQGVSPADIPVETPIRLEFVINRWVVEKIGVTLPEKIWRLADDVVSIPVE